MGVQQYEDLSKDVKKLFKLDTKNTSYVIAVVDDEQFLLWTETKRLSSGSFIENRGGTLCSFQEQS